MGLRNQMVKISGFWTSMKMGKQAVLKACPLTGTSKNQANPLWSPLPELWKTVMPAVKQVRSQGKDNLEQQESLCLHLPRPLGPSPHEPSRGPWSLVPERAAQASLFAKVSVWGRGHGPAVPPTQSSLRQESFRLC